MRSVGMEFIIFVALAMMSSVCYGQVEPPTDPEFLAWPSYCQARYVTIPIGEQSPWAAKIPKAQIELAKREIGENVFLSVHHACAGSMWLQRARYERDRVQRKFMFGQVIMETSYTVARIPDSSQLLPGLYANLATASKELGNSEVQGIVHSMVYEGLTTSFEENPSVANRICNNRYCRSGKTKN